MNNPYSIEELVVNDSFINYCKGNNEGDTARWDRYLLLFPHEKEKVTKARNFVLGITHMLKQNEQSDALNQLKESVAALAKKDNRTGSSYVSLDKFTTFKKYLPYAAAMIIFGSVLFFLLPSRNADKALVAIRQPEQKYYVETLFQTPYGQKKEIWLPDSSRVILNAGSTLRVDSFFGKTSRKVSLIGEALFDVKHNSDAPFSVHVTNFEVKVLGTLFNVKAYPADKAEEASLIRGKIELVMKDTEGKSFILQPNQKAAVVNKPSPTSNITVSHTLQKPLITPVSYSSKDSSVIETLWVYNRFDIYNKKFDEIQHDLERLYNVKISFTDSTVSNYRFSATFENETIDQVLQALQFSYPFHYKIQNNQITISK